VNVSVNVARILQAMEAKQLKIVDVCRLCGVNNKTLAKILRGEVPRRIDALYRVLNGLQVSSQEVVVAPASKKAQGPRLYVVPSRR
jgi:transcriptional regulator with XRE-family HTH domain